MTLIEQYPQDHDPKKIAVVLRNYEDKSDSEIIDLINADLEDHPQGAPSIAFTLGFGRGITLADLNHAREPEED